METQQAVKMIGRLLRGTPEAAAQWIMQHGLTEAQAVAVGAAIAANPFFQPPRHKPKERKEICPQCGQHFTYQQVTTPRKFCSDVCLDAAHNRYQAQRRELRHAERGFPVAKRPDRYKSKAIKEYERRQWIAQTLGYDSHSTLPIGVSIDELEQQALIKARETAIVLIRRKPK